MVGPVMQRVSEIVSSDISNYLTNKKTWDGLLYNVKSYGAKGDGTTDDTAAIESAIAAAAVNGGTVHFPPGTYKASFTISSDNISLELDGAASITGTVTIAGNGFIKSNTVSLTGDFTVFPAGTTTFSGNFTNYVAGDKVVIETTVQDAATNQIGVDFGTVVTASATQLVISLGTKFAYNNPTISKITGATFVTGSIAADDSSITGDFTSTLVVGDIIRVENRNGTGGVDSSSAYFETHKVVAIDNTKITTENKFTHSFTDFWVVKMSYIENVRVTGGKINTVATQYITNYRMTDVNIGISNDSLSYALSLRYLYDFSLNDVNVDAQGKPTGIDSVYSVNAVLTNVVVNGARGTTDNANLKLMSNINCAIDTIVTTDTMNTSSETIVPFFTDYYYTPYKVWNDKLTISTITAAGNKNAEDLAEPDFWIIGVKNSTIDGITCNNPIRVSNANSVIVSAATNDSLFVIDQGCSMVTVNGFRCGSLDISGTSDRITFSHGALTSKDATNSRIIYLHGSSNVKLLDIEVSPSNFTTLYIQDTNIVYVEGITDTAGGTNSVEHGVNVTNARYSVNYFNKLTPLNTTSIVSTNDYGITKGVNVPIFIIGRNSYAAKGNITGDGTAYKCAFDGDGLNFSNKNSVINGTLDRFTVPLEAAGKYQFTGSIGLENVGTSHTLGELYIRKNDTQNYYLDYRAISTASTISVFLSGSITVPLNAGDFIELFVKVSGGTLTVTWGFSEFGGQFSGTLLYAQ